jgi:hypothetical protein
MIRLALLLSLFAMPIAGATDAGALPGLLDEMSSYTERQAWAGVERTYEKMMALEGVEIPREVHLQAAHSARAIGRMDLVVQRLERAQALERTEEETRWLSEINENYAFVELRTVPARSIELVPELMPFQPDARLAVEKGITALAEDGEFVGMLPVGDYQLGGKDFEVIAGITAHVELSTKELKAEKKREK